MTEETTTPSQHAKRATHIMTYPKVYLTNQAHQVWGQQSKLEQQKNYRVLQDLVYRYAHSHAYHSLYTHRTTESNRTSSSIAKLDLDVHYKQKVPCTFYQNGWTLLELDWIKDSKEISDVALNHSKRSYLPVFNSSTQSTNRIQTRNVEISKPIIPKSINIGKRASNDGGCGIGEYSTTSSSFKETFSPMPNSIFLDGR